MKMMQLRKNYTTYLFEQYPWKQVSFWIHIHDRNTESWAFRIFSVTIFWKESANKEEIGNLAKCSKYSARGP